MNPATQSNSSLNMLRAIFPNCEESLILLPKVADVFEQQPFLLETLTHRSAIEEMKRQKNTGFIICSNSDPNSGQFIDGACLFIPTPALAHIWMIKTVHFCKSPASSTEMETILRPLLNQSAKLGEELASIARDQMLPLDFKIPLRFLILLSSSVKKSDMKLIEKFVGEESKQLESFKIETSFVQLFKTPQIQNTAQPQENVGDITESIVEKQKNILSLFILKRNRKINVTLRSRPSKGFNGASLTFDQVDKVLETFDMFLPGRADYLQSIPDLYKMTTSLLFKTDNVTGKLKSDAKSIQGGIMLFWSNLISKLNNPVGVLLKSYDHASFNSLYEEPIFNLNFEINWVYVGNQMILALEVGLSDGPDSPETTISNKLTQVLTKTVPTMQIILYAMLANFNKNSEQNWTSDHFWNYLRRRLKIVLYMPNVALADIQAVLTQFMNSEEKSNAVRELQSLLTSIPDQRLDFLELLLSENTLDETEKPKMYVITPELTLEQSQLRIEDIFRQEPLVDDQEYKRVNYISSLLTMSSLLMKQQVSPQESPDSTLNRRDNYFKEDAKKYADKNKLQFLDIILSPQQHRILHQKEHKRLYILGEPGSGKTSLLLAKAKMSAEDEKIKRVVFFLPERKTELREFLKTFPNQPGNEKLKEKLVIVSENDMTGPDNKLNPKCLTYEQLHDSIVLADEIYATSVEEISRNEMKYIILFNEFITHAEFIWITNVVAGQSVKLRQRVYLPGFKIEPLAILFRSSHHISSFSTNFIRTRKNITQTTAKVAGCFTSKQTEIPVRFYSSRNDVDLNKEMQFDPEFNFDRKAIIFSSDTTFWEEKMQSCSSFITQLIFSTPSDDYFSVCYTGSECTSVVLIIDELPNENQDHETYGLLNLALTRAQFEVFIFANAGFRKRLEPFLRLNKPKDNEKIVSHAANQLPVDLRLLRDSMTQKESMELSVKLIGIAVLHSNEKLLEMVFRYMPKQTKLSLETIMKALDTNQPKKIRQLVIDREQHRLKTLFRWAMVALLRVPRIYSIKDIMTPPEFLHLMIVLDQTGIIDGLKEVIGTQAVLRASKFSGDFLFAACANGNSSMIIWVLDLLRECKDEDLVGMEMRRTYKLMRMYEMTLLTVLCYQNFGMAQSVQVILDNGFPNNLLLSEFQGRNALHLAIWGKNLELVKVLLGCPDRRATFLGDSVKYEGKTAFEYAKSLGYEEIESQIASYCNRTTTESP